MATVLTFTCCVLFPCLVSREKIPPTGVDTLDATPKNVSGERSEDRRPKDIVEQLREFKEAIKPKPPATNGKTLSFPQNNLFTPSNHHCLANLCF